MPILEAVAAAEDEGETASSEWIVERSGLTADEVGLGGKALAAAGYVDAQDATGQSETVPYYLAVTLLERGRRTVGAWPAEDGGVAAFLELVDERIEQETDPEMKSKLQKLRASAQDLGKGVGTAIFAAWLQKMAGI